MEAEAKPEMLGGTVDEGEDNNGDRITSAGEGGGARV